MLSLLLGLFVTGLGLVNAKCNSNATTFDFIVVGGGTAGLAFSSRLSQSLPQSCILVLEAGQDGRLEPDIYIPGRKGSTIGTKYDWNLTSTPQAGLNSRVIGQTRGKVLGGSSALNLMVWDRATTEEFDAWEDLGNPGWNWKSMLPAMLKAENFLPSSEYEGEGVARSGPIQALINRILPEHQKAWIPTMNSLGVATNLESLGGNSLGVMRQPSNIRESNYTRSYSTDYLPLAGPNLAVRVGKRVAKINFKKLTATGVTLEDGTVLTAKKEVILSAGTFHSAQLLELSGIGSPSVLSAAGIPLVKALPGVGENLQDHIRIHNSYQLKPNYTSTDIFRFNASYAASQRALWEANQLSLYDYTASGYTFLNWSSLSTNLSTALTNLAKSSTLSPSSSQKLHLDWLSPPYTSSVPQLEIIFSDGYTGVRGYPQANSTLYGKMFFTLISGIQHPLSRGSTHISSANLSVPPTINPNYLSHPYDLAAAIASSKFARKIANEEPMRGVWDAEYEPGDAVQTEKDWEEYAKRNVLSIYHPVGTCAMMREGEGGVVGPDLKVHGVRGLRVVDASIVPVLVSAHLQTMVYGVAERGAEMVARDYK
ncbi:hypothetical protein BCR34DRAFT_525573 [Clohesyomyces aquaticus]|uniref:Glucose-methanol-choline oxidoreductase N-terminal domain-containing protein n=1 Tax=Clohesyomyces aquaticus TaxID=1231657 RepID=A0A1Y1YCC0_9PLEO|nr:hypothetical protein BCR34DRAFT_525573 [Clohesyomyces aquaticus]